MKEKRLFLILFLLAVLLFVLDKKGGLVRVKGRIERAVNPVRVSLYSWLKRPGEVWEGIREKEERVKRVKKVEQELEVCRVEKKNLEEENEDLRRLLQAPLPKEWAFLPAQMLGKNRYLIIDQGEETGVRKGMTVVFENFLVGKVVKTNQFSSLILLPFDSESRIEVKTERGVKGLLEGRFGTKVFLTRVLQKEKLTVGELVVTSGEEYLANLLVGKIKSESGESEEPFQEVEVEPGLEYGKLTTVFLVK